MLGWLRRNVVAIYAALMLLAALGYARYDVYMMDGDGTAFLDIAQALSTGHSALAINGYWNPAYPAALALGRFVLHPSLARELVMMRLVNVCIFALAMAACVFFTRGLARLRTTDVDGERAVSPRALDLLGLTLLLFSAGRELAIAAPRADTLLLAFLLLAAGMLVRIMLGSGIGLYALLGIALGCAYLTKSFAFLPAVALLLTLLVLVLKPKRGPRTLTFAGVALACIVFAAIALPYAAAISRQLGHLTTGESARMNYCFFIDQTPRWHEDYTHDLGHAAGTFTHPEKVLANTPPTFSFAEHAVGTFPLWFDGAWWTDGLKPHFWLRGHVLRLARCTALLVRYLLGRPEVFVILAVLLAFGARLRIRRGRPWPLLLGPFAWGVLMLAIYFPIDLQDRYLMAPFLLVVLPIFAGLRVSVLTGDGERRWFSPLIASALLAALAGIALTQAGTYLAERRRLASVAHEGSFGDDAEVTAAGDALTRMGVRPGDKLACFGDIACYTDHYWARRAGAQILAEVQTPDSAAPEDVWNAIPDKRAAVTPLKAMRLDVLVAKFPNSARKPDGWVQLGKSDFFAYPLRLPLS